MTTPGVTVSSYPGERATLIGRLWVAKRATGVAVTSLNLRGRNRADLPSPIITASDTVWRGNDVTNRHDETICFHLGSGTLGDADRTLIEDNRIHHCGKLPAANHHHGIYVLHADDSIIRDNLIYGNADRGINLYPNAQRVLIENNVLDGNGEGIMFAGSTHSASSGNVATGNIISNSKIRWNVESFWPGEVGTGNRVYDNCLFASNPRSAHYNENGGVKPPVGFTAVQNLLADPLYLNRLLADFRLQPESPCQGYGPEG
jgi:parallel beta-helix repeat protein